MLNKWFHKKNKSLLGIDISSAYVKIVEISHDGERYHLHAYAREPLPEGAMEGNTIKENDAVSATIKRAMTSAKFTSKRAAIAVPDSAVISKVIQLNDGLSDEEMEELVVIEADKFIPYSIDEINIDFEVQGPSKKNASLLDVLIVASRAENVSLRADAVTQAGLEAAIVEVESYAVERAVHFMASDLPAEGVDKIIAVLDIGLNYTQLYVFNGLKLIFSREEDFGSRIIVDSISQQYNISHEDAFSLASSGQLPEDYDEKVLMPFKEMVLTQIKRTLQFFYSTSHYNFIDQLLLSGGAVKQEGLVELIQSELSIPAQIVNPMKHLELAPSIDQSALEEDAPSLLIACGLALREDF